jgi:RNA ligase
MTLLRSALQLPIPKFYEFHNVHDIIKATDSIDIAQEGWVAEFSDGQRFKFKGDRYVELHRLISNISFKNVLKIIRNGEVDKARESIPDEFLIEFENWVDQIENHVSETKQKVASAMACAFQYNFKTRKDFALWVNKNYPDLAPYLFAVLDNKSNKHINSLIYKREF